MSTIRRTEQSNDELFKVRANFFRMMKKTWPCFWNSFQPSRYTSEFVRKQLQNTIHGRQKPTCGKDISAHNSLSANLDSSKFLSRFEYRSWNLLFLIDQKGAYFRSQLATQMSTPPLQTNLRQPGQQQHQSKATWFVLSGHCHIEFAFHTMYDEIQEKVARKSGENVFFFSLCFNFVFGFF